MGADYRSKPLRSIIHHVTNFFWNTEVGFALFVYETASTPDQTKCLRCQPTTRQTMGRGACYYLKLQLQVVEKSRV